MKQLAFLPFFELTMNDSYSYFNQLIVHTIAKQILQLTEQAGSSITPPPPPQATETDCWISHA